METVFYVQTQHYVGYVWRIHQGLDEIEAQLGGNGASNVALSNSDIDSNTTGISGTTRSIGNHRLFANSSDGTPPVANGAASSEFEQR